MGDRVVVDSCNSWVASCGTIVPIDSTRRSRPPEIPVGARHPFSTEISVDTSSSMGPPFMMKASAPQRRMVEDASPAFKGQCDHFDVRQTRLMVLVRSKPFMSGMRRSTITRSGRKH
jgi:hypothetical protein